MVLLDTLSKALVIFSNNLLIVAATVVIFRFDRQINGHIVKLSSFVRREAAASCMI